MARNERLGAKRLVWTLAGLSTLLAGVALAGDTGPGTGGIGAGNANRGGPPGDNNGADNDPCDTCGKSDPIELSTGEFSHERTDLTLPGMNQPLEISFEYRSQRIHNSHYGYGWYFPWEVRLFPQTGGNVAWQTGTGHMQRFTLSGSVYVQPPGFHMALTQLSGGGWQLRSRSGELYLFNAQGLLTQKQDTAGNATVVTWETNGSGQLQKFAIAGPGGALAALDYRIKEITGTLGKKVYCTYYGASDGAKNGRLKRISDDYGRQVDYDYDVAGNLIEVLSPVTTYQDQTGTLITGRRATYFTYTTGYRDARPGAPESRLDHNLLTITDDRGFTQLVNFYDELDRVDKQQFNGGTSSYVYTATPTEHVTQVDETDANGFLHRYIFDTKGNPTTIETDGVNIHTGGGGWFANTYTYNSASEVTEIRQSLGNGVEYTYDAQGNVLEERCKTNTNATNSSSDLVRTFTYEPNYNHLKTATDELGYTTTYFFDYEEATLGDLNGDGLTNQNAGQVVKIAYPDATKPDGSTQTGIAKKLWYNAQGQLIRTIDGEGRVVEWQYYSSSDAAYGLLHKSILDPGGLGLTTEFTYDSYGFVATRKDARGNMATYTHNSVGECVEFAAPLGVDVMLTYDSNGNVVRALMHNLDETGAPQDPEWIACVDEYDAWNRLVQRVEDVANDGSSIRTRTTLFDYDGLGHVVRVTTPEGRVLSFAYDERGNRYQWTRGEHPPIASTSRIQLDVNGRLVQSIDGNGKVTARTYDLFDRLLTETDPEGDKVEVDWNKRSEPTERRMVDPTAGVMAKMQFTFDQLGRPTKQTQVDVTNSSNKSELWAEYDKSSRLVKTRSARGYFTQFAHDAAGRVTSTTDALGNATSLTLDGNGNVTLMQSTEKVPGGSDEVYEISSIYDELDRMTELVRTDRLQSTHELTWTLAYDSRHNVVEITDPVGRVTHASYDLASRVTGQSDDALGLSIETSVAYDDDDLRVGLLDADGFETTWQHDVLGRATRVDYEGGLFEAFTYDAAGNVLTSRTPDGVVTTNTYFGDDQLKDRTAGTLKEEYTWNALGSLDLARERVSGTQTSLVTFQHDGFGRVSSEAQDSGTVTLGHDLGHNVNSLGYPASFNLTQAFDQLDRLTGVSDSGGTIASYTWMGPNRLQTRTSGTTQTYVWDGLKRLTRINAGTTYDVAYGYDDLDQRAWKRFHHRGGDGDVYDHDGGSRLTQVWYGATDPSSGTSGYLDHLQINLSKAQDRVSTVLNGVTTNYNSSDALHRYTSIGSTTRTYDAKGNLTNDGSQLFEFDAWNRLTRVRDASTGAERARYEHDALGRRTKKIEGTKTTRYVYLGERLLQEDENTGSGFTLKARYVYGEGLDELVALDHGGNRYFAYEDALGSVEALTDNSGAIVERYEYDAFGTPTVLDSGGTPITGAYSRPASSVGNGLWFTAARWDAESGHYHMRARQYEPLSGRFISRDPLGYVDGPNPYSYCFSDPTDWVDPFGLKAQSGHKPPRFRNEKEKHAYYEALRNADANRRAMEIADAKAQAWDVAVKTAMIARGMGRAEWQLLGGQLAQDLYAAGGDLINGTSNSPYASAEQIRRAQTLNFIEHFNENVVYDTGRGVKYVVQHGNEDQQADLIGMALFTALSCGASGPGTFGDAFSSVAGRAPTAAELAAADARLAQLIATRARAAEQAAAEAARAAEASAAEVARAGEASGSSALGRVCRIVPKDVIGETLAGKGPITSAFKLTADEALTAAEDFLGPGYSEIGKVNSGVYRSADGLRQFRMDSNSLLGAHSPGQPHVHFELYAPGASKPFVNNHVILR